MQDAVKIIECPRDAWQGLRRTIAPEEKAAYLRKLIDAGFRHIDAVSFVSPASVPQMADSEQVLKLLSPSESIEIIGIVVNEKGAQRAIETEAVQTLGFPYSISEEFLRRNQRQTAEQALDILERIATMASGAGLEVVAYVSMAFGNPYAEPWTIEELTTACELLSELGIEQISLADTVGLATPQQIAEVVDAVTAANPRVEIGVHLHSRPDAEADRIRAAYNAGCRRFDSAIGGLGGCPFAQDAMVGNIATEILLDTLSSCGAALPNVGPLDELIVANAEITSRFGSMVQ